MKIAVVGLGYVGLSNAALLARRCRVIAVDVVSSRVDAVNARRTPFHDAGLEEFLQSQELDLHATTDAAAAYADAAYVVIATPTDYDPDTAAFDTRTVEAVIDEVVRVSPTAIPVVKSTVPVGFCAQMSAKYGRQVVFSPEFLREGMALHDVMYPNRIIVGDDTEAARTFGTLLAAGSAVPDVPVLAMTSTEAEAVKLFANTYLAMRVAYFNELDTFAATHGLNTKPLIEGVSLDPRIGMGYNNPSFGYGAYCLPKDTKQLLSNFQEVPQRLIEAIVDSNATRMDFIADEVLSRNPQVVGIHRLAMKAGSDNFRASSILGVIERLRNRGVDVVIYEPTITAPEFQGMRVEPDLAAFKRGADVILANRRSDELADVSAKLYTRDIYSADN